MESSGHILTLCSTEIVHIVIYTNWNMSRPAALKHRFLKMHTQRKITLEFASVYSNMYQWLSIGNMFNINVSNP